MRINVLVLLLLLGALSVVSGQHFRRKRGIGSWITGMFSRFKKSSKKPVYHIYPSYGDYGYDHGISFGPAPKPYAHHQYAAHHPHYVHGGGYSESSYSDYGGHGHIESNIHGGYGPHKEIPYGFGPIKESDVLGDLHSSGSFVPEAPHIVPDSYGVPQSHVSYNVPSSYGAPGSNYESIVVDYTAPKVPNDPFSHSVNSLKGSQSSSDNFGKEYGKGSFVPTAPFQDNFESNELESDSSVHGYLPTFPERKPIGHGQPEGKLAPIGQHIGSNSFDSEGLDFLSAPAADSYKEPSSISVTNEAYKPPGNGAVLPLSPHSNVDSVSSQAYFDNGFTGGKFESGGNQIIDQIASGAIQGAPFSYFPQLGPDDPIIEIVFEDGDPLPVLPPAKIDPSLFLPAQDDVEVYFIEYASEDEINDIKNIDVGNAKPAILESLPDEVPYNLRNKLLQSGILENAQIEIINLDNAVNDKSLDSRTRHALANAYNRRQRQATKFNEVDSNKQDIDIRIKKLSLDSNTPEGAAEFISGLKGFNKGTFAGVVDINDETSQKFLPVQVNGKQFPLPENIQLSNKKVKGVLILADKLAAQNNRQPKDLRISGSQISKRINSPQTSFQLRSKHHDHSGWVPINS